MLVLCPVILRLLFNVLELIALAELRPGQIRIEHTQPRRCQIINKLPQKYHVVLDQVESQAVSLLCSEVVAVLVELLRVFFQEVQLVLFCL